jgi:hypothetical protein
MSSLDCVSSLGWQGSSCVNKTGRMRARANKSSAHRGRLPFVLGGGVHSREPRPPSPRPFETSLSGIGFAWPSRRALPVSGHPVLQSGRPE